MEVANTLAYNGTATITDVKSFIVQTPGVFVSGKFFGVKLIVEYLNFIHPPLSIRLVPNCFSVTCTLAHSSGASMAKRE